MITNAKTVLKHVSSAAMAVWLASTAAAVVADQPGPDFVLSIVADMAYGDRVQRGEYAQAIRRIRYIDSFYPYPANTNLCVAYIMLEQYEKAQPHCDKAVALADKAAQTSRKEDLDYRAERSAALTNRGALRALIGNPDGAQADFREALALNADTAAPEINLRQLQKGQTASLAGN